MPEKITHYQLKNLNLLVSLENKTFTSSCQCNDCIVLLNTLNASIMI